MLTRVRHCRVRVRALCIEAHLGERLDGVGVGDAEERQEVVRFDGDLAGVEEPLEVPEHARLYLGQLHLRLPRLAVDAALLLSLSHGSKQHRYAPV